MPTVLISRSSIFRTSSMLSRKQSARGRKRKQRELAGKLRQRQQFLPRHSHQLIRLIQPKRRRQLLPQLLLRHLRQLLLQRRIVRTQEHCPGRHGFTRSHHRSACVNILSTTIRDITAASTSVRTWVIHVWRLQAAP